MTADVHSHCSSNRDGAGNGSDKESGESKASDEESGQEEPGNRGRKAPEMEESSSEVSESDDSYAEQVWGKDKTKKSPAKVTKFFAKKVLPPGTQGLPSPQKRKGKDKEAEQAAKPGKRAKSHNVSV